MKIHLIDWNNYKSYDFFPKNRGELADMVGRKIINLIINEECYTSKCDSLALEPVEKYEHYLGKRKKRGLFQSSTGRLLNADVNGVLNILRKVSSDSQIISEIVGSGCLHQPTRVNIL